MIGYGVTCDWILDCCDIGRNCVGNGDATVVCMEPGGFGVWNIERLSLNANGVTGWSLWGNCLADVVLSACDWSIGVLWTEIWQTEKYGKIQCFDISINLAYFLQMLLVVLVQFPKIDSKSQEPPENVNWIGGWVRSVDLPFLWFDFKK